ncbi:MAG: PKD domain-containing protein [Candidatus Bipolaricaulota bacterium]|nr:PKD domain-containing protein [Candidatus Bipolaricaulota bacterium]
MRTTTNAARGKPLAVALLFLLLACTSRVVWGEGSLQVEQSLSPAEINVVGVGTKPDTATVSMALLGQGGIERYPLDCVVVIDTSASAQLGDAKAFAFDLIGRLAGGDRVGVVAFGTTAELVVPLTPDKMEAKLAVGNLKEDTKSALGSGLLLARQELQRYGREEAVLAIVLIADGQNNVGTAPTIEGMVAGETGIRIVTVGLAPIINRTLLMGLAEQSGGVFVQSLSSEAVDVIAQHLAITAAATDVTITKHVPAGLHFVGAAPTATQTRAERDGSTTVTWRIAQVGLGQIVRIDAKFDAPAKGSLPTDDLSKVTYRDFRGVMREAALSPLVLSVIMPNRDPVAAFAFDPSAPTAGAPVTFRDQSRDIDDNDQILGWQWTFGDGTTSDVARPEHRYAAAGTYTVSLRVLDGHGAESEATTRTVVIGNGLPVPSFTLREPETLRALDAALIGVDVLLDASGSYDVDGTIARYGWDLDGDGDIDETSTKPSLSVSFPAAGDYVVGLTVTDDYGNVAATTATFAVVSSVTAERMVDTYLPNDETIAGAVVQVTIVVSANASLDGMAVSETLPTGWTFRSVEADGASVKTTSTSAEWVFPERLTGGTQNSKREIRYELTAPSAAPTEERQFVTLRGSISSSSPRVSETTLGEDKITLLKYLSIPVAISCWNTQTSAVDLKLGVGGKIAFDQIQKAIQLWFSGGAVPQTDNRTIDLRTLEDLIAYWLTGSSVYDPLP